MTQALAYEKTPPQSVSYLGATMWDGLPVPWLPLGPPALPPPAHAIEPVRPPVVIAWGTNGSCSGLSGLTDPKGTVPLRPPSWKPPGLGVAVAGGVWMGELGMGGVTSSTGAISPSSCLAAI